MRACFRFRALNVDTNYNKMNNNNNECNHVIDVKIEESANGIDTNIELPIIITSSASCCSDTDLLSHPNGIVTFNNETSFISYEGNEADQLSFMRTPSPGNLNTSGTSRGVRIIRHMVNRLPVETLYSISINLYFVAECSTMVAIAEQRRQGQTTESNKNDKLHAI